MAGDALYRRPSRWKLSNWKPSAHCLTAACWWSQREAVASCLLACQLGATHFIISTDVDKVALNFGRDDQVEIDRMNAAECRKHLAAGHFAAGSMQPKIESALKFLEHGGEEVIIAQPQNLKADLQSIYGTHIVP